LAGSKPGNQTISCATDSENFQSEGAFTLKQ